MENNRVYRSIRNFSIIAHVDHGKSTLADRIIELTNFREDGRKFNRILDSLDLEKQRGITIKLNAVSLCYFDNSEKQKYSFNLIDTPGHADFRYEVSRSLAACEGVILLVDATKGVQAQTLAYFQVAKKLNLKFLPVVNKIDLPFAQVGKTMEQLVQLVGCSNDQVQLVSAKTGQNIPNLLKGIVKDIPGPEVKEKGDLRGLVFDLSYDRYNGVVVYTRIFEGSLSLKQKIKLFHSGKSFQVEKLGVKTPENVLREEIATGEIGWFTANIRRMQDIQVGETITSELGTEIKPFSGYQILKPNLYSNIYSDNTTEYKNLRKAVEELQLQDSALQLQDVESNLLGAGFRCGFLGLLHQEIIQARIRQEYKIEIITTPPSLSYRLKMLDGKVFEISNPQKFPSPSSIATISELFIRMVISTPERYLGEVNTICQNKRGIYKEDDLKTEGLWQLVYEMPFTEFIFDFNDKIKSASQGYASFEYEIIGFREARIVKVDILLNGEMVSDLSFFVHQISAYERSRKVCDQLRETLSPQNFEVAIQACIGKKIIARETLKALRKNVIGKCYGGDITRKKKLLEKQKKGKKKMKELGNISFSKSSFRGILRSRK